MDLIVYCAVLLVLGLARVRATRDVSDSVGIVETGGTITVNCELPIGQNLALIKEPYAYTIIIKELGLG